MTNQDEENAFLPRYEVGDTISYETFGGRARTVVVYAKYTDIKHGEPGFTGTIVGWDEEPTAQPSGLSNVWGYSRQVIAVIKKKGTPA